MILCSGLVISHPVRGQVSEDAIKQSPRRHSAIGPDRSADDRPITTGLSRRVPDDCQGGGPVEGRRFFPGGGRRPPPPRRLARGGGEGRCPPLGTSARARG